MTQKVYEGCDLGGGDFIEHDMTFEYVVENIDYDPTPGVTNGFSGFQLLFPGPVPELYNQQSPVIGGPWQQNAFSGNFPPFGAEWDASLPGVGIMPGETGAFSFCTFEREDVLVEAAGLGQGPAGWGHTWGLEFPEPIIDADGTVSAGDGVPVFVEVTVGDALTSWPTGRWNQGLDMFDTDGSASWTFGDDLHVEDPATHPGAIRDGFHDDLLDPIVLDLDGSLDLPPNKEPVSCDMETGTFCPAGLPGIVKFFDTDGNGFWDDGEDIVLDSNDDGFFGTVFNTQTFIFHGFQSVPGPLLNPLGIACNGEDHIICKKVKYSDDGDGIIEVGEKVDFLEVIQVHNSSGMPWTNVVVKDRWGAEIDVTAATPTHGTAALTTKGKSEKEFLEWVIGNLADGETASLVLRSVTDLNPAAHQEYTECSYHEFNSGAVLKFRNPDGKQRSYETGGIIASVLTEDALGDCDEDWSSDADELTGGTDPHNPDTDGDSVLDGLDPDPLDPAVPAL
jgi:hypothetical protein